ncbi:transposase [Mycobacterium tuberculosis]|nr:transposase [Mycobacterium tuberculosis]
MPKFEVPDGWTVQAFRFTLDPTEDQAKALARHFGARRKAYNWTVATLKADIQAWHASGTVTAKPSLRVLRKRWNTVKDDVCVNTETGVAWWPECSKEAYADGIAGAVEAYWNWQTSRAGKRAGKRVGFPRFKRKGRDQDRVSFTTGAMRVEPDRRHLTLPVIGTVRTHENTRRIERLIKAGRARVLAISVRRNGTRLDASVRVLVQRPQQPKVVHPGSRVGVDVGVRRLATVATADGTAIEQVENPRPLGAALRELRHVCRARSRCTKGSRRYRERTTQISRLHRRVNDVRTHHLHVLTTRLAQTHGRIVVEGLDATEMLRQKGLPGARARRRGLSDAALGTPRRHLSYKTVWYGSALVVADRWFPSLSVEPTVRPGLARQVAVKRGREAAQGCRTTPRRGASRVTTKDHSLATESPTLQQLGEFAVIDRLVRGRRQPATVLLGPGDDAALVSAGDGRTVVSTDMLVQDSHFRLDWSTPQDVGRKAIAQNAADIEAMGARATAFVVGFGAPAETPAAQASALVDGMWEEAGRIGAGIVGGDLVSCRQWVVSVTAIGDLDGRAPVLRSGAKAGSVLAVVGELGRSAAGYALWCNGIEDFAELRRRHLVPQPPYGHGAAAAAVGAQAMIDVSDGLLADLRHIAEASGVRIDLSAAALAADRDALTAAATALGTDPWPWVLSGGEDHALVACFVGPVPAGWRTIGRVLDGPARVLVDGEEWTGYAGWQSFGEPDNQGSLG